jgi:hypothetical protein
VKLKLDVSKAVVGLAAHPTHSQLLALYEDGGLRSYVLTSGGLQALWAAPFMLPGACHAMCCACCCVRVAVWGA